MSKLFNLARMSVSGTPRTGAITLGSAVTLDGVLYRTFAQAGVQDGDVVSYGIEDTGASEVGWGVYTATGTSLSRNPTYSTSSNAAISLTSSAQVFITPRAEHFAALDTIASASITDLAAGTTRAAPCVTVSGSVTITSFGSSAPQGAVKFVHFSDAPTITASSAIILPGSTSTAMAAGDCLIVRHEGSGIWRVLRHEPASGNIVINGDVVFVHPLTVPSHDDPGTNIGIGKGALASLTPTVVNTTQYMTCVGFNAGHSITTSDHITAIGAWSLASFTTTLSASHTAVGIDSMRALTTGTGNVGCGEHTITNATSASYCTAVGVNAMLSAGGTYNTFVGFSAGQGTSSPSQLTGEGNTGVGHSALVTIAGAANNNTAIGRYALTALTTGSGNVGIGYTAGITLTTGSNNLLIGTAGAVADVPSASTSNYLNIANMLTGTIGTGLTLTGTFAITGNVSVPANATAFSVNASNGNVTIGGTLALASDLAIATTKFNVQGSTGNVTHVGDLNINTGKFTVTASSGNTTIAGTLALTSDLAVNTNKFNVTASSGNTAVAGTLAVAGNSGFNGTSPIAKPTVTGSRGGNAALASLLTALANYGLVTDSSS